MSVENLVNLYHTHHCLVYPTWGEGFGFIPLQGLASGMPTITTYPWANYEKYIGPLKLKSTYKLDFAKSYWRSTCRTNVQARPRSFRKTNVRRYRKL